MASSLTVYPQYDFCLTKNEPDYIQYLENSGVAVTKSQSIDYIRIYFHVIRKSDGTGGRTIEDVYQMLEILRQDFAPHNIAFQLECMDYIDNDIFYSFENVNKFGAQVFSIIGTNYHQDGIDIYVYSGEDSVNDETYEGGLADTPSEYNDGNPREAPFFSFIAIGGISDNCDFDTNCKPYWPPGIDIALSGALTHEMGHCLGLHHTFRGACGYDPYSCQNWLMEVMLHIVETLYQILLPIQVYLFILISKPVFGMEEQALIH
ncbi:MAG: M43 family zinc metalloprotease [Chitinophagales bacterium]